MDDNGGLLKSSDHCLREPRRDEVLGAAGVVARVEVVSPVGGDFHGRERTWTRSRVDDGDRDLGPSDVLLDERALVVGEAANHGRAELIGIRGERDAEA